MRELYWISSLIAFAILYLATYSEATFSSRNIRSTFPDARFNKFANDLSRNNVDVDQRNWNYEYNLQLAEVLENLTAGYDKRVRPHFNDNVPEKIEVSIEVTQLGPFTDMNMDFDCEVFLRIFWKDERLKWDSSDVFGDTLELPDSMFEDFWKPDVFFRNSKSASTHEVTQPNRMFFIYEDGAIKQSERVSVRSHCFYDLHYYPFDSQKCNIEIESFKFPVDDVELIWDTEGLKLSDQDPKPTAFKNEWELVGNIPLRSDSLTMNPSTGLNHSRLNGEFYIIRNLGSSFIQTFIPSAFVVIMSLVGFWIDNEDAIERIALAVVTILTLTKMTEGIRIGLPKVSYVRMIDTWMLACTILIYLALFQSAWVHYILRCGKKKPNAAKSKKDANGMTSNTNTTELERNLEDDPEKPKMHYWNLRENTPEMALALARKINLISKILIPVIFITFTIIYLAINLFRYYDCKWNVARCAVSQA